MQMVSSASERQMGNARSAPEEEGYAVAAPGHLELRNDQRHKRGVFVGQVAHVGVIDIATDEPAHRSADENVGREMFLGSDARGADNSGEAIGDDGYDGLMLVFVADQGRNGPYLDSVTRG